MTNESRRYKIECIPVGNPIEKTQILTSEDIYKYAMKLYGSDIELIESFIGIYLDNNMNVIGWAKISTGGTNYTLVDTKVVFKYAVDMLACHIVAVHNHPSGNLTPSREDKALTERIAEGSKLLSMRLVDHVIVSKEGHYSFHDHGLL